MCKKRSVTEQVALCPLCLLLGYLFASLRKYNEVDYKGFAEKFPKIALITIIFALCSYLVFTVILRTKIRTISKDVFKIFDNPCGHVDYVHVVCGVIVFYSMYMLTLQTPGDYPAHTSFALTFDWRSIKKSIIGQPYPMWHCAVSVISKVFYIPPIYSAALVTAGLYTAEYCVIRSMIVQYNKDIAAEKIRYFDVFACSLMYVQPIHIPWFNPNQYLGQGTPNIWHNPTIVCSYPFALVCTYLFIKMMSKYDRKENVGITEWAQFGIFLFLSVIAKPSFIQIFVPAAAILFIIMLIKTKGKSILFTLKLVAACVPAGLWCIFVFITSFISADTSQGNGIAIGFLDVWSLSTPNVLVSLLISIMFPLAYLIVLNRKAFNKKILISLLLFLCGLFELAFLKETGPRERHGNWGWGFMNSLSILFVMCGAQYMGQILKEKQTKKIIILPMVIYVLNILFGFRYYIELFSKRIRY